jgi:hypothetical protein
LKASDLAEANTANSRLASAIRRRSFRGTSTGPPPQPIELKQRVIACEPTTGFLVPSGTIEIVINLHEDEFRIHEPISASTRSAPFSADTTAAVARYQVLDVDRAIAFYTEHLGFHLE